MHLWVSCIEFTAGDLGVLTEAVIASQGWFLRGINKSVNDWIANFTPRRVANESPRITDKDSSRCNGWPHSHSVDIRLMAKIGPIHGRD